MGIQDVPCDIGELEKSKFKFYGIKNGALYCSPLKRAKITAEYLFPDTPVIIDKRLEEKNLGDWAGQSKDYLQKTVPEAFLESGLLNPFFTPPNGESFENLRCRCVSFLKEMIKQHRDSIEDNRVYVVTHNGTMRTMRCIIEQRNPIEVFNSSELYLTPADYSFEISEWDTILKNS